MRQDSAKKVREGEGVFPAGVGKRPVGRGRGEETEKEGGKISFCNNLKAKEGGERSHMLKDFQDPATKGE